MFDVYGYSVNDDADWEAGAQSRLVGDDRGAFAATACWALLTTEAGITLVYVADYSSYWL